MSIFVVVTALFLMLSTMPVHAAKVYFCDDTGQVGSYDTVSTALSPVGNLSATFSIGQVIGMAFDSAANRLLILDREGDGGGIVYSMEPDTGTAVLLFTASNVSFQGGAVKNGVLYGINEGAQTIAAYDLTTFISLGLAGGALPDHAHSLGIDPASGQLYSSNGSAIYTVADSGAYGSSVVSQSFSMFEDIDYFEGNFLGVTYGSEVYLINGVTGAVSTFLNSTQVASAGVTGSLSGIVLSACQSVPGAGNCFRWTPPPPVCGVPGSPCR